MTDIFFFFLSYPICLPTIALSVIDITYLVHFFDQHKGILFWVLIIDC